MDWYESQWWLNATKNGSLKWKNGGRNRTKVYIYPSYGIDEPKEITVRTSTTSITTSATHSIASTINPTTTDDETLIILPGILRHDVKSSTEFLFEFDYTRKKICKKMIDKLFALSELNLKNCDLKPEKIQVISIIIRTRRYK